MGTSEPHREREGEKAKCTISRSRLNFDAFGMKNERMFKVRCKFLNVLDWVLIGFSFYLIQYTMLLFIVSAFCDIENDI